MMPLNDDYEPLLSFRLVDQSYALPVAQVREVMAMVKLARLPAADAALLGMANRHGEMLPILDVRQAFGLGAVRIDTSTLFIVAATDDQMAGLVVDEIDQVRYIHRDHIRSTRGAGKFIDRVASTDGGLLQLIALPALFKTYFTDYTNHTPTGETTA